MYVVLSKNLSQTWGVSSHGLGPFLHVSRHRTAPRAQLPHQEASRRLEPPDMCTAKDGHRSVTPKQNQEKQANRIVTNLKIENKKHLGRYMEHSKVNFLKVSESTKNLRCFWVWGSKNVPKRSNLLYRTQGELSVGLRLRGVFCRNCLMCEASSRVTAACNKIQKSPIRNSTHGNQTQPVVKQIGFDLFFHSKLVFFQA